MDIETKDKALPATWLRGVPNDEMLTDEDFPTVGLFQFDENPERTDNNKEVSINWYDEPEALHMLFLQTRNGNLQFRAGVACFSTSELCRVCRNQRAIHKLSYERRPIIDVNPFHGNILIDKGIDKAERNMILSSLIFDSFQSFISRPESEE